MKNQQWAAPLPVRLNMLLFSNHAGFYWVVKTQIILRRLWGRWRQTWKAELTETGWDTDVHRDVTGPFSCLLADSQVKTETWAMLSNPACMCANELNLRSAEVRRAGWLFRKVHPDVLLAETDWKQHAARQETSLCTRPDELRCFPANLIWFKCEQCFLQKLWVHFVWEGSWVFHRGPKQHNDSLDWVLLSHAGSWDSWSRSNLPDRSMRWMWGH